jgi:hypothetical protein
MRNRSVLTATAAVLLLATSSPASAQAVKDAVQLVPKDSLGFVLINNPGATSTRLGTLANNLGLPLPPGGPLELLRAKLGVGKSLDEKGITLLAVLPGRRSEPAPILFLPVHDYKEFLKEVKATEGDHGLADAAMQGGQPLVIGAKGAHAVLASGEDRALLKKILAAKEGASGLTPLIPFLSANDVSGVVTPQGLKAIMVLPRGMIWEARQRQTDAPPEVGQLLKGYYDFAENFLKSVESNVAAVAGILTLDQAGGAQVHIRALFKKGGEFARAAEDFKGLPGGPLAGLPDLPFAFATGGVFPDKLRTRLSALYGELFKTVFTDLPPEKLKKFQDAIVDSFNAVHGMGFMVSTDKGGGGLVGTLIGVAHVVDAPAYLESSAKAIEAVQDLFKEAQTPFPLRYETKRTKVAGVPALEVAMQMPGFDQAPEEMKKIMEALMGPGGKLIYTTAAVNEHTVLMRYTPAAGLKGIVKSAKGKGLAAAPEIMQAMSRLPAGAQWAAFASPFGILEDVNLFWSPFPGAHKLPAVARTPPVGLGVKLAPAGLEIHLVAPADALQALGRLGRELNKQLKNAADQ